MWRVDLHRALASMDVHTSVKDEQVNEVAEHLVDWMERHTHMKNLDKEVCLKVVNEVFLFSQQIRLASELYELSYFGEGLPLFADQLDQYHIIDLGTGMPLPRASTVTPDSQGRVGRIIWTVFPSLVRQSQDGNGPLVLEKATVVVEFEQEVRKKPKHRRGQDAASSAQQVATDDKVDADHDMEL
jgi:hypothetical protein